MPASTRSPCDFAQLADALRKNLLPISLYRCDRREFGTWKGFVMLPGVGSAQEGLTTRFTAVQRRLNTRCIERRTTHANAN
jgi:hypothetical protein